MASTKERENFVYIAKLAEQAERYEGLSLFFFPLFVSLSQTVKPIYLSFSFPLFICSLMSICTMLNLILYANISLLEIFLGPLSGDKLFEVYLF